MGYNLYITRKSDWIDEESSEDISLTGWVDYVNKDDEMQLGQFAETLPIDGQKIKIENEGLSIWTKYSKNGINGNFAWFTYIDGQIVVKNPDKEIVNKMIDIASTLGAKVQGDDGELYESKEVNNREKQAWWKFWK